MILRQFSYLDTGLVDQFLAQLEDGVVTEQRYATTEETEGGGKGGLNLGLANLQAGVNAKSGMVGETSYAIPAAGKFNRLRTLLQPMQVDEEDPDLMVNLEVGSIVEISCSLEIATISKIAQNLTGLKALGSVIQRIGADSSDEVGGVLEQMDAASDLLKDDVFVATTVLDPDEREGRPALLFRMYRENVERGMDDLEGEVKVCARVTKKWKSGVPVSLYSLPGVGAFSRKQRREFERSQRDNATMMTSGPAVSLDVIAVYT